MSDLEHENVVGSPGASTPDAPVDDAPLADYKVGYKRPPPETRFQPGRSGNPKGRPKGRSNHRTTVNRVMNEKVSLRQGDETRRITKFEAVLQAQANKGMKGDARSAAMVLNVMSKSGLLDEPVDATKNDDRQTKPNKVECAEGMAGDLLFDRVNDALLSREEKIELAQFAEKFDRTGFAGFTTAEFERIKQLMNNGRVKDPAMM